MRTNELYDRWARDKKSPLESMGKYALGARGKCAQNMSKMRIMPNVQEYAQRAYMRKLCELRRDKIFTNTSQKNSFVKKPIQLLEAEHVQASSVLKEIKEITQNFSSQANAPKEYQKLMEHLKEFEVEFHVHLHIENNILFPKVIALEEQLSNLKSNQA
jgi:hemerythrin-like domain-containing protein